MPWVIFSYANSALNLLMTILVILSCIKYLRSK